MTTHTRISAEALSGLDYLCEQTGDNRSDTLDRVINFAINGIVSYKAQKLYNSITPVRSLISKKLINDNASKRLKMVTF